MTHFTQEQRNTWANLNTHGDRCMFIGSMDKEDFTEVNFNGSQVIMGLTERFSDMGRQATDAWEFAIAGFEREMNGEDSTQPDGHTPMELVRTWLIK